MKTQKNIFAEYKDAILDYAEAKDKYNLELPLPITNGMVNNYPPGDFIVVGGRKTSGKSSFMLYNYVISPLIQKINSAKTGNPFNVRIIYMNCRKNNKTTIERMIVNYLSTKNNGNKISVPSLYGFKGKHVKIARDFAKKSISTTMAVLDTLIQKQILNVISSRKTVMDIEDIVQGIMEEYGKFHDFDNYDYERDEKYEKTHIILVIDDITGLIGDSGGPVLKFDNAHKFGVKLKQMAKALNILVVLGVPSSTHYSKGAFHKSTIEEVSPYNLYADRVLIMHNPLETGDNKVLGYEINNFVNKSTGICYFRMLFVGANYMGPSGIYIPYFLYPENGFMLELPRHDAEQELALFYDLVDSS